MSFPEYLKGLMARKGGMTQRALAAYVGVTPPTVGDWLRGEYTPRPAQCKKVAAYFDRPEQEVLRAAGHLGGEGTAARVPPGVRPEVAARLAELPPETQGIILDFLPALEHIAQELRAREEEDELWRRAKAVLARLPRDRAEKWIRELEEGTDFLERPAGVPPAPSPIPKRAIG
ncbi:MAG: helix-turn-helix domain-containing protein [Chloroflexi bacterium]|nr:helix-turn-helix domain-containing protein [Chloroflexota bacterium]